MRSGQTARNHCIVNWRRITDECVRAVELRVHVSRTDAEDAVQTALVWVYPKVSQAEYSELPALLRRVVRKALHIAFNDRRRCWRQASLLKKESRVLARIIEPKPLDAEQATVARCLLLAIKDTEILRFLNSRVQGRTVFNICRDRGCEPITAYRLMKRAKQECRRAVGRCELQSLPADMRVLTPRRTYANSMNPRE